MITTHQFTKKPGHPNCEHKHGSYICGQPRELHKKPKKGVSLNKDQERQNEPASAA